MKILIRYLSGYTFQKPIYYKKSSYLVGVLNFLADIF